MKRFLKIFLIFLYLFFTLGINNCEASIHASVIKNSYLYMQQDNNSVPSAIVTATVYDTAIVSSNNNGYEISALKSDKDGRYFNHNNEIINNNLIKQQYKVYSNRILNGGFHNISPTLIHEICIHAP